MDVPSLFAIEYSWDFLFALGSVVLIDLVLAGDNAVIIALAAKRLPKAKRKFAIMAGAGIAVALRVLLTFFASQLLLISYVKLVGGLFILWIAVKLLTEGGAGDEHGQGATSLWHAMWIIIAADITMSLDNVLALAGASHGNLFLLLFGLGLSIPLVVFASSLLSGLMDKYPIIVYIGAAVLGKVGAELILTDQAVSALIQPSTTLIHMAEALAAVGVVAIGHALARWRQSKDDARFDPELDGVPAGATGH